MGKVSRLALRTTMGQKMRQDSSIRRGRQNDKLPSVIAALDFVCWCFGVGEKEFQHTLERVQGFPNSKEHFPSKYHRMLLSRSRAGDHKWDNALLTIQREALYDHIRRQNGKPLFTLTGDVTDKLVNTLTRIYEKLLPELSVQGIPIPVALWIVVRNVLIPTVFIQLINSWQLGLGGEFRGESCWYLPRCDGKRQETPISRVLDCWLRVAGFRTAYGVSKEIGTDRSQIDEWLRGEKVPDLRTLHRTVDRFADSVSWLDDADTWKTRFTLACAMQRACQAMDETFKDICPNLSRALARLFRNMGEDRILCDEWRILANTHTFFTVRLLQLKLKREGRWDTEVAAFYPKSSLNRHESECPIHPGNRFLAYIKSKACSKQRSRKSWGLIDEQLAVDRYLLDVAVSELNRLFKIERKKTGKAKLLHRS